MPGLLDTGFAQWLRNDALYSSLANSSLPAGLNASAIETEIVSPLITKAAADSELARQIAVLGGPLALDRHVVKGQRRDLVGQCITLTNELLGYTPGAPAFVISADEQDDNLTILEVVRSMAVPFSPLSLSPTAWYDPSDLSSMRQGNTAGSAAAAVNAEVGYLADKSGNGNHATQATSANRPILRQSGALYYLEFDGVDDQLMLPMAGVGVSTIATVGNVPDAGATNDTIVTLGSQVLIGRDAFAKKIATYNGGDIRSVNTMVANKVVMLRSRAFNDIDFIVNGAVETFTTGTQYHARTPALGSSGSTQYADFDCYGVVIFHRAITNDEAASLATWLGAKAGLTV